MARTRKDSTPLSPAALLRYFRGNPGRLIVTEHDKSLWVTDSYMAVRLSEDKGPMERLLALYNLPFEPMVCDVDQTIVRRSGVASPPDIGRLIPTLKPLIAATRFCIGGSAVLVEGPKPHLYELWTTGDQRVCMNPAIVKMVNLLQPGGEWKADPANAPTKPLVKVAGKSPVAIAMPVRNLAIVADETAA